MKVKKCIELLLLYGLKHQMIEELDVVQVRNQLLDLLGINEAYEGSEELVVPKSPVPLLEQLLDYAVTQGMIEDNITKRDLLDAKIMAQLMPRQSEVYRRFNVIKNDEGIEAATDYYYQLSKDSNYIRMDRIAKNEYWTVETKYGEIEITINLSKPEKDSKEIEKARSMPSANYPKCFLCLENVGYYGRFNHPGRSNHRVLPITLNNEQWYFQYSPYVYYNEHSILFKDEHVPMQISKATFKRLLDFVEQMPHYFVGSNADLPIVGGSILSHEHFQGGHHTFAMEKAKIAQAYTHEGYKDVNIGRVKWPLSVIRLSSKNKEQLIALADYVLNTWRNYTDEEAGIYAFTENEKGELVPHNTITPISRINQGEEYELDLVLRNNRRDEKHPDGIFHPYKEYHHIKKENIGLIEVMGLAVLPARLKSELEDIKKVLEGTLELDNLPRHLNKHKDWIQKLVKVKSEHKDECLKQEIGRIFTRVLECGGVFKCQGQGIELFNRYLHNLGCK